MADTDTDAQPPDEGSSDDVAAQLDVWIVQARWLYEDARYRFDSLGRQATALLAISGVLLGLLATAEIRDARYPGLFIAAVAADVLAASLSVWALRPHYLSLVNVSQFRDSWLKAAGTVARHGAGNSLDAAPMIETLLHGRASSHGRGPGPLQELADAAKKRGRVVFGASVAVTLAVLLVGVYVAIGALK